MLHLPSTNPHLNLHLPSGIQHMFAKPKPYISLQCLFFFHSFLSFTRFFLLNFFLLKIFKFFFLSFQHFEFAMFISFSSFSKLCTTHIHIFKCTSTLFVLSSFFLALSSFKLSSNLFKLFLCKTNFSWEVNMGRHMMKLGEPLEFVQIQV